MNVIRRALDAITGASVKEEREKTKAGLEDIVRQARALVDADVAAEEAKARKAAKAAEEE